MRRAARTIPWRGGLFALTLCTGVAVLGCSEADTKKHLKPLDVRVSYPITRTVTDHEVFTGRTEPYRNVDIKPQVTGNLEAAYFEEGQDVEEGMLLFKIQQAPFKADLDKAEADLERARADLRGAERDYNRATKAEKGISAQDKDKAIRDFEVARAQVLVSEASLAMARVTFAYTEIRAPLSGRISKRQVDPGNIVKANETVLTNLVSLEPMYATFFVDERTMLRVRRLVEEGKVSSARIPRVPALVGLGHLVPGAGFIAGAHGFSRVTVHMGLADEDSYPHKGAVNFVDNQVDSLTGTLRARGVFPNLTRLLSPGMFVRVQVPIGRPHKVLLVAEAALGTDQGRKVVYVVGKDDKVVQKTVKIGALQADGMRVIEEGVTREDRVVVTRLQSIRAGMPVQPSNPVPMEDYTGNRKTLVTNAK